MSGATTLLEPDLEFKQRIVDAAGDLSHCYQCGTCSIVCAHSTVERPLPRPQMLRAQWGLRDAVLSDPAIWLCHGCAECSAYCPRDAKPASAMAALRDASIGHYAVPRFMGRALSAPRALPLLVAPPVLALLAILGGNGTLAALPPGRIVFSKFLPILAVEVVFVLAMTLAVLGAAAGGLRYWRAMTGGRGANSTAPSFGEGLLWTLATVVVHRKFRDCRARPAGNRDGPATHLPGTHLAAFYGFLGLVATTTAVAIGIYAFGYPTPWPLWHPVKLLGNASGLVLAGALLVFAARRLKPRPAAGPTTYADWLFLTVMLLTVATGFLSQLFRLAEAPRLAYPTYFVHLVCVFFLLVYLPYSKFAHVVYRFAALLFLAAQDASDGGVTLPTP